MTDQATLPINGLIFHKSSYSGANTSCVEVATWTEGAAVRDSKDRHGGYLAFSSQAWSEFTEAVASDALK